MNAIAWQEHIPFAMALIQMIKPRVLVELGVHTGDSYLAFCQAVSVSGISTACYGVDTWQGDPHAGFYGDEVLRELKVFHDPNYSAFSRLIQGTFDDAATHIADGSVDLLHIDGLHTYEAVKHDWEKWHPKVSSSAVVLFHDTNVRERDFGVWRLWEEIRTQHRHFEFLHGHGLGMLVIGSEIPASLNSFLSFAEQDPESARKFFFALGNRLTLCAQCARDSTSIDGLQSKILEYDALCRARGDEIGKLVEALSAKGDEIRKLNETHGTLSAEIKKLKEDYECISTGTSFRVGRTITAPLRFLMGNRTGKTR